MIAIDPAAAAMPRRALGATVDASLLITAMGLPVAVIALRAPAGERMDAIDAAAQRYFGDARRMRALQAADPARRVLMRATRSPGSEIAGIRRVDAATGGPPSLRSALIETALVVAMQQSQRHLNEPRRRRMETEHAQTQARMQELRETLADDPERLERELTALALNHGRGCLPAIAAPLAISVLRPLSALASPRRQTVFERLAGVAVVRERD